MGEQLFLGGGFVEISNINSCCMDIVPSFLSDILQIYTNITLHLSEWSNKAVVIKTMDKYDDQTETEIGDNLKGFIL